MTTQWISIEDRLPEADQNVLLYVDYSVYETITMFVGHLLERDGHHHWAPYDWNGLGFNFDDITHWMPLPEPPEELS